jgi:Transposase DDE domain
MEAFVREVIDRLPLAQAVLQLFDFALEPALLQGLYEENRGRCYTADLTFATFVRLVRDCLLVHGGSGHQGISAAEQAGQMPVDESSFYRKLGRMPAAVSEALLRQCTARLGEVMPAARLRRLPACVDAFEVVVFDGKKLKRAAKRLKQTRGYGGKLLAAKVLVAMNARSGLAMAMNGALDGESNDLPLVPGLLPQVRERCGEKPILFIGDRQFGDLRTPRLLAGETGRDHYLLGLRGGMNFTPDPKHPGRCGADAAGRRFCDQIGWLGGKTNKGRLYVRRITLALDDGGELILITDLLDRDAYPAADLLDLYRKRWGIEQLFQLVSEVFELRRLIGTTPLAGLFQASFCLLMYNLIQVVKSYAAKDGRCPRDQVSTHNLFDDVKRELICWTYFDAPARRSPTRHAQIMRQHLQQLLRGIWRDTWIKASDKKPRKKRPPDKPLRGGHTSVWRLLQAAKIGAVV